MTDAQYNEVHAAIVETLVSLKRIKLSELSSEGLAEHQRLVNAAHLALICLENDYLTEILDEAELVNLSDNITALKDQLGKAKESVEKLKILSAFIDILDKIIDLV